MKRCTEKDIQSNMDIHENLLTVLQRIREAEKRYGRRENAVQLLAVSKKHAIETVKEAFEAGQCLFGESYVQEGIEKIAALNALNIEWHFIGPLQSNKTQQIAGNFSWVHSIDREKIAKRLNDQRPIHLPPLNVCIEVNVSGESSKSGVSLDGVSSLATFIQTLPRLKLRGLMTIPAPCSDFASQRKPFKLLAQLFGELNAQGMLLDTLSMGMSDDFEAAIAEGSTLVRIGTSIFGPREL